ncbi:MAG: hypothetical protein CMJ78_12235 [Planctomycetaceae bacterium]|nr:hypothetical protein [Planctomycetaceae bacterium]
MKDKLKNLDYKKLLLDHCEKMILGVLVLFVLFCLSGTSWSRYERVPEDYTTKVNQEQQNLDVSTWPEDKRLELDGAKDISVAVDEAQAKIDVGVFEYQTPEMFDLYPQRERRKQPSFLAVEDLIAIGSEVILEFLPEQEQPAPADVAVAVVDVPEAATPDPNLPADPNAPRSATAPRNAGGAAGAIPGGVPAANDAGASGAIPSGIPGGVPGAGGMQTKVNAEGRRFVAVLGVFPLREQANIIAKALNMEIASRAIEEIDFIDFELERQTARAGANPWTGKWEKVNFDVALSVLDKVDFDVDVVDAALTDYVFTMPLPRRVAGDWDFWATHPRIKKLTKEEAELQERVSQLALQQFEEQKAKAQPEKAEKRGFSSKQNDLKGARMQASRSGNLNDMFKQAMEGMGEIPGASGIPMASGRAGIGGRPGAQGRAVVSIAGQVLLFRYFDFDVLPGNAYRYRVRLELRNPNYNLPIYELEDPSFADGQTRKTPWSGNSNSAVINQDTRMYLTKVEKSRSLQRPSTANIEIFQYYQKAGTTISTELRKLTVGEYIAAFTTDDDGETIGGVTTTVLRPAEQTMDEEDNVEFATRNLLLDLDPSSTISAADHPDLNLDPKRRDGYGFVDQVVVLDDYGRLKTMDTVSQAVGLARSRARLDAQRKPWEAIVKQNAGRGVGGSELSELDKLAAGVGGAESAIPGYGPDGPGATAGAGRRPGRARSSRKKR